MPAKNRIKSYVENGYYHIYNRGVNKLPIFLNHLDYSTFLSYLKTYLSPKNEDELKNRLSIENISFKKRDKLLQQFRLSNFNKTIQLLSYCLMPNHIHFLIHQTLPYTIKSFMQSFSTRYSMYFNKKYKRVGPIFQGTYKAVFIKSEEQLLHLSRYIHYQSLFSKKGKLLRNPQPSSFPNYTGEINQEWIKPNEILAFFEGDQLRKITKEKLYEEFVENYKEQKLEQIQKIIIEEY